MSRADRAEELFVCGYNCAQAVFGAFAEDYGIPLDVALKLSSSFGGGVGRLREVCGAVSGMVMTAGLLYGYDKPEEGEMKGAHYARVRQLCAEFEKENGSIVCRDILGRQRAEVGGVPTERTDHFYKTRPCIKCVRDAADAMERFINEHPINTEAIQ